MRSLQHTTCMRDANTKHVHVCVEEISAEKLVNSDKHVSPEKHASPDKHVSPEKHGSPEKQV